MDFDHHDRGLTATNIWDRYEDLRRRCPVEHSDAHGGFWTLSRYVDVETAAADWETFSSARGTSIPRAPGQALIPPIDFDPPRQRAYRKIFASVLGRPQVTDALPLLNEIVDELVGDLQSSGGGDFVARVALPMPLQVLIRMLGFSIATVERARPLAERMWESFGEEAVPPALAELLDLLMAEVRRRREAPREDLITQIIESEFEGRGLDDDELGSILATLVIAGHETTLNAAGTLMLSVARDRALQERLRGDPAAIEAAVEEGLRLWTPAQIFARTATREVEIGDRRIGPDERVLLLYASANRDAEVFDHPDVFNADREPHRHLAFGWGVHMCVGAHLARTELRMLLRLMLACGPFDVAGEVEFSHLEGGHHMGVRRLPIKFDH